MNAKSEADVKKLLARIAYRVETIFKAQRLIDDFLELNRQDRSEIAKIEREGK